jgi:tRNA (uracil-5-)-methyltransferase
MFRGLASRVLYTQTNSINCIRRIAISSNHHHHYLQQVVNKQAAVISISNRYYSKLTMSASDNNIQDTPVTDPTTVPQKRAVTEADDPQPQNQLGEQQQQQANEETVQETSKVYEGHRPDRPKQQGPKKPRAKRFKEPPAADPVSNEGVLIQDIKTVLRDHAALELEDVANDLREFFTRPRGTVHPEHREVVVRVQALSGGGDGIGFVEEEKKKEETGEAAVATTKSKRVQVVAVPYTLPGELVECKIYKTQKYHFEAQLLKVIEASPKRDDSLIKCRYFGTCSGCQYQMLPYAEQLEIKRQVIVNAYKHNSGLDTRLVPEILPTVASPKEYYYRTKLTPHFDVPRAGGKALKECPPVGFGERGRKTVVDIEECAIGTPIINQGLKEQRAVVASKFNSYKKGATILLRENLKEVSDPSATADAATADAATAVTPIEEKICCTSTKEIITERVGKFKFQYASSSFFQNNNSILEAVTSYVRDNLTIPATGLPPTHLVDTYCGCGLFGITCAGAAESVIGVEISRDSVTFARTNAQLNGLTNATFIVGNAEHIFEDVKTDPASTAIIIDPPRKGCDDAFLEQLLQFRPAKVVYVSCNVHSQARDIGYLLNDPRGAGYKVVSIRGFDFFPQTHHVESVTVLALKA